MPKLSAVSLTDPLSNPKPGTPLMTPADRYIRTLDRIGAWGFSITAGVTPELKRWLVDTAAAAQRSIAYVVKAAIAWQLVGMGYMSEAEGLELTAVHEFKNREPNTYHLRPASGRLANVSTVITPELCELIDDIIRAEGITSRAALLRIAVTNFRDRVCSTQRALDTEAPNA